MTIPHTQEELDAIRARVQYHNERLVEQYLLDIECYDAKGRGLKAMCLAELAGEIAANMAELVGPGRTLQLLGLVLQGVAQSDPERLSVKVMTGEEARGRDA